MHGGCLLLETLVALFFRGGVRTRSLTFPCVVNSWQFEWLIRPKGVTLHACIEPHGTLNT